MFHPTLIMHGVICQVSTAIVNILATKKMSKFFQEVGRSPNNTALSPPTPQDLAHFATINRKYGYWNASPEKNEMVGISVSLLISESSKNSKSHNLSLIVIVIS